jgi:hypothetical protein
VWYDRTTSLTRKAVLRTAILPPPSPLYHSSHGLCSSYCCALTAIPNNPPTLRDSSGCMTVTPRTEQVPLPRSLLQPLLLSLAFKPAVEVRKVSALRLPQVLIMLVLILDTLRPTVLPTLLDSVLHRGPVFLELPE